MELRIVGLDFNSRVICRHRRDVILLLEIDTAQVEIGFCRSGVDGKRITIGFDRLVELLAAFVERTQIDQCRSIARRHLDRIAHQALGLLEIAGLEISDTKQFQRVRASRRALERLFIDRDRFGKLAFDVFGARALE
jgi:hypothetical protein